MKIKDIVDDRQIVRLKNIAGPGKPVKFTWLADEAGISRERLYYMLNHPENFTDSPIIKKMIGSLEATGLKFVKKTIDKNIVNGG